MTGILERTIGAPLARATRQVLVETYLRALHLLALPKAGRYRSNDLKLNVGCGPNLKPGWVNIDFSRKADLRLDVRQNLPFRDNSAVIVYSEHFLEHLEYPEEAMRFLRESRRVLGPGGLMSIGVPDTEWPLRSYADGSDEYFRMARELWHPAWCNTRMHNINFHFREQHQHKYAYDFETLAQVLQDAGFERIARRDFDPALDSEGRRAGTLYVEAYKPRE